MTILDGRKVAESIYEKIIPRIAKLKAKGVMPALAAVLIGDDESSQIYVSAKERWADKLGIDFLKYELPGDCGPTDLKYLLQTLNDDKSIHGILVQLPLPKNYHKEDVVKLISPQKDIDGFDWILNNRGHFLPPTPAGIVDLLEYYKLPIRSQNVVIVGSGFLVGQPLEVMLRKLGAKVRVCDSKTEKLDEVMRSADILISATGVAGLINSEVVKKDAVVVDVGNTHDPKTGKVVGDVNFVKVKSVAGAITPVPGGVGPITIAKLLENLVLAAEKSTK